MYITLSEREREHKDSLNEHKYFFFKPHLRVINAVTITNIVPRNKCNVISEKLMPYFSTIKEVI